MTTHLASRRGFLGRLLQTAAAAPVIVASFPATAESDDTFKHPSEYVDAMLACGMRPVAGFQGMDDGGIHKMGVFEYGPHDDEEHRWPHHDREFAKICWRVPEDDGSGKWWDAVWRYLYDEGMREDLTPKGYFEHPSEYLEAMRAIGITPVACIAIQPKGEAFKWIDDGPDSDAAQAITARMPVQPANDRPLGTWWSDVWDYLCDRNLVRDETDWETVKRAWFPNGKGLPNV